LVDQELVVPEPAEDLVVAAGSLGEVVLEDLEVVHLVAVQEVVDSEAVQEVVNSEAVQEVVLTAVTAVGEAPEVSEVMPGADTVAQEVSEVVPGADTVAQEVSAVVLEVDHQVLWCQF
jgi:hypothetical protein